MASKDLTRYYKIQPHERGLGFIAIEYIYDRGKLSGFGQAIITVMIACVRLR